MGVGKPKPGCGRRTRFFCRRPVGWTLNEVNREKKPLAKRISRFLFFVWL